MDKFEEAHSRLRDLQQGWLREVQAGHYQSAALLTEAILAAVILVRRLTYIQLDKAAHGDTKAANDGRADPGIPPTGGD